MEGYFFVLIAHFGLKNCFVTHLIVSFNSYFSSFCIINLFIDLLMWLLITYQKVEKKFWLPEASKVSTMTEKQTCICKVYKGNIWYEAGQML